MPSIFTKIIAGELPGNFVWRDEHCVGLMTIQPIRPGHVLVIPRQEVNHWDDVDPKLAGHLVQVSQKITKGLKKAYPARRVGLMIAGLEVPHTHLHLIPLDSMRDFDFARANSPSPEELAQAAENIRKTLTELGHTEASA